MIRQEASNQRGADIVCSRLIFSERLKHRVDHVSAANKVTVVGGGNAEDA